ncbi:hypothetical protein [Rhodanobacter sp. FW106-PBR-LB-2-11]|uniref:hypothetical protein n=1 Tax=Rhodanobacter sp. FW106-PBR-LB-2-11 TaxID=1524463 RepID=UPI0034E5637B
MELADWRDWPRGRTACCAPPTCRRRPGRRLAWCSACWSWACRGHSARRAGRSALLRACGAATGEVAARLLDAGDPRWPRTAV